MLSPLSSCCRLRTMGDRFYVITRQKKLRAFPPVIFLRYDPPGDVLHKRGG
jgi:hypothetical protein